MRKLNFFGIFKVPIEFGTYGSAAGSVSQRYESEDPDPHPDPYQNVKDPEHWSELKSN
jgi:hypothetical protein